MIGSHDDEITQADKRGRDGEQHHERAERARNMDSFQDAYDRIKKIGNEYREQQGDHDIRGKVQEGEDDCRRDDPLRRVRSRSEFDVFDLHIPPNST